MTSPRCRQAARIHCDVFGSLLFFIALRRSALPIALVPISVVPLPAQSDHLRTIGGIVYERHAAGLRPRAGRIGRDADRAGSLCCQLGTAVIGLNEPTGN